MTSTSTYYWSVLLGCLFASLGISVIVVPPLTAPLIGGLDEHVKESAFLYGSFTLNLLICILCLLMMCALPKKRNGNGRVLVALGVGSIGYYICHIIAASTEFSKVHHTSEPRPEKVLLAGTVLRDGSLILSIAIQTILLIRHQVSKWSEMSSSDDNDSTYSLSKFISPVLYYIASIIISFELVVLAHSFFEPALEMWYEYNANTTEFSLNCQESHKAKWIDYFTYFLTPLHHEFVVLVLSLWLTSGSHHEDQGNIQDGEQGEDGGDGDGAQGISRCTKQEILTSIFIIIAFIASGVYFILNFVALFHDPPGNSEFYIDHWALIALYVVALLYTIVGLFAPNSDMIEINGINSQEFNKSPLNVEEYILLIMCGFEVTFFLIIIAASATCQSSKLVCEGYENAREFVPLSLMSAVLGILQVSTQTIFLLLSSREKRFCEKSVDKNQSYFMLTILMAIIFTNLFTWMSNSLIKGVNEHDHYELEPILELLFGCVTTKIVVLVFFRFLAFFRFHSAYMTLELFMKYKQHTRNIPYEQFQE